MKISKSGLHILSRSFDVYEGSPHLLMMLKLLFFLFSHNKNADTIIDQDVIKDRKSDPFPYMYNISNVGGGRCLKMC